MRSRICNMFQIEVPVFAFSRSRAVVAEVSRAGGMGVLGALAFSPAQLEEELAWLDANLDGRPYGVDVVMPAKYIGVEQGGLAKQTLETMIPEPHKRFVEDVLERYEVPPLPEGAPYESLLGWSHSSGRSHVEVALAHPIRLLVNALGPPPPDVIEKAHQAGVKVAALVGTVAQAQKQVAAGVDIIVAQGSEAGGHTGEIGTMVLVPDVVDAVHPTPVLAAGGIACGRQVAAALALGADGVWTGSLWLAAREADTHPIVVDKLLKAGAGDTVRSRSMSGKPARQLRTAWTEAWDDESSPGALPMPLQFMLTAEAISRIHHHAGHDGTRAHELLGTPVGQVVGRMKDSRPAAELVRGLVEEMGQVVRRLYAEAGATGAEAVAEGVRRESE